jgi:hypothetical protein
MKKILIAILIITGILFLSYKAMILEEKNYCIKLQDQAKSFQKELFFITLWEKQMCDEHKIEIDARVDCVNGVSEDVPRCPIPESYFND